MKNIPTTAHFFLAKKTLSEEEIARRKAEDDAFGQRCEAIFA